MVGGFSSPRFTGMRGGQGVGRTREAPCVLGTRGDFKRSLPKMSAPNTFPEDGKFTCARSL